MNDFQLPGGKAEQEEALLRLVISSIGSRKVTLEEIDQRVRAFSFTAEKLAEPDLLSVIAQIETLVRIIVDPDIEVVDPSSFANWLTKERLAESSWDRWEAYGFLLQNQLFSPNVIDRMDKRAESILELAGDPLRQGSWARRGLVIGDVQSGKTANYLALFNKAADAGYKIIILFGGHTDKLRRQTQQRVDEGFVGSDSRKLIGYKRGVFVDKTFGVGLYKGFKQATSLTTWSSDFSTKQLIGTNLNAEAINGPVVFVIKKNKSIIENLIAWLHSQSTGSQEGKLDLPMLLLDDEADYASINTRDPDSAPTAVNAAIRNLLAVFAKNTYIGFTATPFANVFIDPDQEEDLFPRDYIISLESPSNYFGPESMFLDRPGGSSFISSNDDAMEWLPYSHKLHHPVEELPESLKDAMAAFFIVNAIRDCRGDDSAARTMMINVSRFTTVQSAVFDRVRDLVSGWRQIINQGVGSEVWSRLERVFQEDFEHQEVPWEQVKMNMVSSIHHIEVHLVNSKTSTTDDWDRIYKSDRARVVAIGGDVLSRGLTLEGLCVTYFRRKSVAYDTLMQMGRWFGYRNGYDDLCKLWIDPEVSSWYAFIAEATLELREQISRMRSLDQTPRQFGLAVRRHPGAALMATALNKRRHSDVAHQISLRHKSIESVRLESDPQVNLSNYLAAESLLTAMPGNLLEKKTRQNNSWWSGVPANLVLDFVKSFRTAKSDLLFADGVIAGHIARTKAEWMAHWDVVVVSGDSTQVAFEMLGAGKKVRRAIFERGGVLYAGGSKLRLGGRGDVGQVLSDADYKAVREESEGKEPGDLPYRAKLVHPLLMLYPIEISKSTDSAGVLKQREAGFSRFQPKDANFKMLGVHIAFPVGDSSSDSGADSELVSWLVNRPWLDNNQLLFEDESED